MKNFTCGFISLFISINLFNGVLAETNSQETKILSNDKYNTTMKQDILTLMMAYPQYVVNVEKDSKEFVYIVMKSGKKIIYDDKRKKSHEEKLSNPDLQDMLEQVYPLNYEGGLLDINNDPGRSRVYELLNEVYGGSQQKINSNLINVNGGGGNYRFNKNNKAADSLKNALTQIFHGVKKSTTQGDYLFPINGTFNYRHISGTGRLSPHAYGIALDLSSNRSDYWKWASREAGEKRMKAYPKELVQIFEDNNFLWGGKWGHFDILHFEYRPEIIMKAKYFGDNSKQRIKWYDGVPTGDEGTKEYIDIIEKVL